MCQDAGTGQNGCPRAAMPKPAPSLFPRGSYRFAIASLFCLMSASMSFRGGSLFSPREDEPQHGGAAPRRQQCPLCCCPCLGAVPLPAPPWRAVWHPRHVQAPRDEKEQPMGLRVWMCLCRSGKSPAHHDSCKAAMPSPAARMAQPAAASQTWLGTICPGSRGAGSGCSHRGGLHRLPLKTRVAQRHWSSEMGMMAPRGWTRPMKASVGFSRSGGNMNL